ncbi:MAG: hypothetical protein LBV58_01455 [Acholeplasmatales bacterium]|nr:hypothetical protein [Acholeplasmatales bacterium]
MFALINLKWWDGLTDFQQIVFIFAATATLLMLIFLIMMLLGGVVGDADFDGVPDSIDGDVDIINDDPVSSFSGLRVLNLRSALAFFSIGGWTAFLFDGVVHWAIALLLGVVAGSISAVGVSFAFKLIMKMEDDGNLEYSNAIGLQADVYIRIPASRGGNGKVMLTFQGRYVECEAITDDAEDLLNHTRVKVLAVDNQTTLIVTKNF